MATINKRRSYSNDTSSSLVMKRLLRKCMNVLEMDCSKHNWNCSCPKCMLLREVTKEI